MARTKGVSRKERPNTINRKYKESQRDRYRRMREEGQVKDGTINGYADISDDRMKRPMKHKLDHMGIPRYAGMQVYDNDRFPYIAEVLCREYGFIYPQLAEVFGVGRTTIEKWAQIHPKFKEAVRRGRDEFDTLKVEKSLLKRAMGYEYTEKTERSVVLIGKHKLQDIDVVIPAREIVLTYKTMPPDVKACMFWLQNRNSDRWKNVAYLQAELKKNSTVTKVNVEADLQNMTVEQIKALRDIVVTAQSNGVVQDAIELEDQEIADFIFTKGQKLLGNDQAIEDYPLDDEEVD